MLNKKKCLITQDLVSSVKWYLEAPNTVIKPEKGGDGEQTWREKAYLDLCGKLRREKRPFPEAARRGVEFEKTVYRCAGKELQSGSEEFRQVCNLVSGFKFYQKGGIEVEIAENKCYLYAKYDAILEDKSYIIDIKTTQSYKEGKYLKGFQHKLYCVISGANLFNYTIVEWDEYPKIKAVHNEHFEVKDRELLKSEVYTEIEECLSVIKDLGLWEDYRNKYCLY